MAFNPSEHLIEIRGKKYLEVKWRLVWFNEERPDWTLETEFTEQDKTVVFKCTAKDKDGRVRATGHGRLSSTDWPRYFEKAETAAIGRCLAVLGYGTQFAEEFDEDIDKGELADAPVVPKKIVAPANDTDARKVKIKTMCDEIDPLLSKKEDYENFILNKTGFTLKPDNYDMIIKALGMVSRNIADIPPQ